MSTLGIFTVKQLRHYHGRYYTYGGFGEYLAAIRRHFDSTILVAHVIEGQPPVGHYEIPTAGLEVIHLPAFKTELGTLLSLPIMFLAAFRHVVRMNVVHARMPDYTGIAGAVAARIRGVPCFHQIVDDWHDQARSMSPFRKYGLGILVKMHLHVYDFCERLVSRGALVFAQGVSCYDKHRTHSDCELVLSSSHHDADVIAPAPKFVQAPYTLLNVARLTYAKNQTLIVRALANLRTIAGDWRVVFVGDGPHRSLIEREAERLGVRQQISFAGQVPRGAPLWKYFDAADAFVLASHNEGTPKVLLEAMARGLPVIASAVSGVPTSVQHEERGLLFEPNNLEGLVGAIRRLAGDDTLRNHCVVNGCEYARAHTVEAETAAMMRKVFARWPELTSRTVAPPETARHSGDT